jgi:hypothetical protein
MVATRGLKAACLIAVLAVLQVVGPRHAHSAEPIRLYVFAGQSNMVGYAAESAELATVDPSLTAPSAAVRFWGPTDDYASRWATLQAPTEIVEAVHHEGFGPEISAAALLAAHHPQTTVAVVKLARGGTDLAYDWNPSNPVGLYHLLITRVITAQRSLQQETNSAVRISGFFWMQGETDSAFRLSASMYARNLAAFIEAARRDLRAPRMPFVIGRVPDMARFDAGVRFSGFVRSGEARVAHTEPYTYLVSTDGLEHDAASRVHFDTRGIVDLGRRLVGHLPL